MISAGNDIVSFAETNPVRTIEQAFYNKFLTSAEVSQFARLGTAEISFHQYIWFLWSAKEAAYKYLFRLNAELVFSPVKFCVTQIDHVERVENVANDQQFSSEYVCRGKVEVMGISLKFGSSVCTHYVHTFICEYPLGGKVYHGVKEIPGLLPQDQSAQVRQLCMESLNAVRFGTKWAFTKSDYGVPSVTNSANSQIYPVSLSHHGDFVAYSFSA